VRESVAVNADVGGIFSDGLPAGGIVALGGSVVLVVNEVEGFVGGPVGIRVVAAAVL